MISLERPLPGDAIPLVKYAKHDMYCNHYFDNRYDGYTIRMIKLIAMAAVMASALLAPAKAAELVMFEQAGCAWCARFNAEIAPGYAKSDEGLIAPLRRIDIRAPIPEDLADITVERFTPTFVLIEDGKEYGRIRGYPGDQFFWFRIDELLSKLPKSVQTPVSKS